ncbi:Na(+)-translocating NADH-quinone reductase subunit F [Mesonia sp. HuA40]|uniref:Na(+)-translocating NADH-quinone reductase subunit F n=1 Tax=Mesonia sp. HuA40 TaxID=2602761 RepID=UPI0011C9EB9E|nr:Na(+)-translocating NADH-quinone reductase subunit F [Mesonia sp. HuA40]TXK73645.1 Na(+)-translocating NADH-quinone reductase subunit F [Mesonia sp. HuA40]
MKEELTEQELHQLAMNIVGEDLEKQGFEFLAVNSKLKKNPQFVVQKEKQMSFVVVRAICHPKKVSEMDKELMQKVKDHALKFEADTYYAPVGLGHGDDFEQPVVKDEAYSLLYPGIKKV